MEKNLCMAVVSREVRGALNLISTARTKTERTKLLQRCRGYLAAAQDFGVIDRVTYEYGHSLLCAAVDRREAGFNSHLTWEMLNREFFARVGGAS